MNALAVELQKNFEPGNDWLIGAQPRKNRHDRRASAVQSRKINLRRAAISPSQLASLLGASVWSATSPEALADVLDAGLDDSRQRRSAEEVFGALFRGELSALPNLRSFTRALNAKTNESIIPDLLEGMRIVSVISGFRRKHTSTQAASQGSTADSDLDLYSLPGPVLAAMLGALRSVACLAALVDLALSEHLSPPSWLVKQVVRVWVDGNRSFLRLAAMMYGDAEVPDDLLPKSHRIDRDQMLQRHSEGVTLLEKFADSPPALK